jgi:hypothetical protein
VNGFLFAVSLFYTSPFVGRMSEYSVLSEFLLPVVNILNLFFFFFFQVKVWFQNRRTKHKRMQQEEGSKSGKGGNNNNQPGSPSNYSYDEDDELIDMEMDDECPSGDENDLL